MRAGETMADPADPVQEARCAYVKHRKTASEAAVGEVQPHTMDPAPAPMCERHIQPDMHPSDLHGKLVRW